MSSRVFRTSGAAVCLVALFLMLGVHWHLLQSVAWMRMLADYSRTGSWEEAFQKTFDGEHPCQLCVQIQNGRQQEERERQETPWTSAERTLQMLFEHRPVVAPPTPLTSMAAVPFVPRGRASLPSTPPKPPPRAVGAA